MSTISIKPIPNTTTVEDIKKALSFCTLTAVKIVNDTAYVQLEDDAIMETLDTKFPDYKIADLNDAVIEPSKFSDFETKSEEKIIELSADDNENGEFVDLPSEANILAIKNCDPAIL